MTPVTRSHISALFTALCGLSLSKVSNLGPNLHGLSTSFQAHISKHMGLILEPKSTFKSSDKKKWIILNKILNHHNSRSHQTTQVQLLESSLGTWWPIKPEATLVVIKYVLVKRVLYLTSLNFFTYPFPHTDLPYRIARNILQILDSNNHRIMEWFELNRTLKSTSFQPSLL